MRYERHKQGTCKSYMSAIKTGTILNCTASIKLVHIIIYIQAVDQCSSITLINVKTVYLIS